MALNTFTCNYLTQLHFKGLTTRQSLLRFIMSPMSRHRQYRCTISRWNWFLLSMSARPECNFKCFGNVYQLGDLYSFTDNQGHIGISELLFFSCSQLLVHYSAPAKRRSTVLFSILSVSACVCFRVIIEKLLIRNWRNLLGICYNAL